MRQEATGDLNESGSSGQTEADRGARRVMRVRKRRRRISLSSSQCGCCGKVAVTVVGGFVLFGLDAGDGVQKEPAARGASEGAGTGWELGAEALDRCSASHSGEALVSGRNREAGTRAGGAPPAPECFPTWTPAVRGSLASQLPWQTGGYSASQSRCLTPSMPRVGQAETPCVTDRTDPKSLSYLPELKPASGTP